MGRLFRICVLHPGPREEGRVCYGDRAPGSGRRPGDATLPCQTPLRPACCGLVFPVLEKCAASAGEPRPESVSGHIPAVIL